MLKLGQNQFNGKDSNQTSRHINLVKERAELLFYRVEEIHARSRLINEKIKPDLVICLHLNAAPWPDAENLSLVERNDYHVLVNGCYMGGELAYDDQRFEMLLRLLKGWHQQEQKLAEAMADPSLKSPVCRHFLLQRPECTKDWGGFRVCGLAIC